MNINTTMRAVNMVELALAIGIIVTVAVNWDCQSTLTAIVATRIIA